MGGIDNRSGTGSSSAATIGVDRARGAAARSAAMRSFAWLFVGLVALVTVACGQERGSRAPDGASTADGGIGADTDAPADVRPDGGSPCAHANGACDESCGPSD